VGKEVGTIYLIALRKLAFKAKMAGAFDEGRSVKLFINCKIILWKG
jgi:hypothetical protein